MEYEVRKETFEINLINNCVQLQYSELIELSDELTDKQAEIDELNADFLKDKEHTKEQRKAYKDTRRELVKDRRELSAQCIELRREMIKEIITSNELEYDAHFWQHKASANDISEFLVMVISDGLSNPAEVSKKK